jgi:hypothetical protein
MSLPIVIRRDSSHTFDSATSSLVLFLHIEFGIGQKEIGGNAVLLMGGIPSLDELQSLSAGFLKSIIQLETRPRGRPLCARTCRSTAAHRLRGRIRIYDPASRTQCVSSKLLTFRAVARASIPFCSRPFHPIRCDFVCGVLVENYIRRASAAGRITARVRNGKPLPHADFRPARRLTTCSRFEQH